MYEVLEEIARISDKNVSAVVKDLSLSSLKSLRKDIALELYAAHKVGLKRAWKLSGLEFFEFTSLIVERGIEPFLPEEIEDEIIDLALTLDKRDVFPGTE